MQIEKETVAMKRELFSYNEIVSALQKGYAIELHFWDYDVHEIEDSEDPEGYYLKYERLPMQIFICHRLRDFPKKWETISAIGSPWDCGDDLKADAYAVPKLQSQR